MKTLPEGEWSASGAPEYRALGFALDRIRVYRHNEVHLALHQPVAEALLAYLRQDLEGKKPSEVEDLWFRLQQCVLDDLLTGITIESTG